jgi:hypothetical protein
VIRVYADENVDQRITNGLRRRGVDVLRARDAGLVGPVPDAEHLAFATTQARVMLTSDTDLLVVASSWQAEGRHHAGLVFYDQRRTSLGAVVREAFGIAKHLDADDLRDHIWFVARDVPAPP